MDRRIIFLTLGLLFVPFANALEVNLPVDYNPFDTSPYNAKVTLTGDFSNYSGMCIYTENNSPVPFVVISQYPSKLTFIVKLPEKTSKLIIDFDKNCSYTFADVFVENIVGTCLGNVTSTSQYYATDGRLSYLWVQMNAGGSPPSALLKLTPNYAEVIASGQVSTSCFSYNEVGDSGEYITGVPMYDYLYFSGNDVYSYRNGAKVTGELCILPAMSQKNGIYWYPEFDYNRFAVERITAFSDYIKVSLAYYTFDGNTYQYGTMLCDVQYSYNETYIGATADITYFKGYYIGFTKNTYYHLFHVIAIDINAAFDPRNPPTTCPTFYKKVTTLPKFDNAAITKMRILVNRYTNKLVGSFTTENGSVYVFIADINSDGTFYFEKTIPIRRFFSYNAGSYSSILTPVFILDEDLIVFLQSSEEVGQPSILDSNYMDLEIVFMNSNGEILGSSRLKTLNFSSYPVFGSGLRTLHSAGYPTAYYLGGHAFKEAIPIIWIDVPNAEYNYESNSWVNVGNASLQGWVLAYRFFDYKATVNDAPAIVTAEYPRYTSEKFILSIDPLYHRVVALLSRNGEHYKSWTFAAFSGEQRIEEYLPAGSYTLEVYQDGTLIKSESFAVGTPPLDVEVYDDSYPKDGQIIWSLDDAVPVDLNIHFRNTAPALVVLSKRYADGSRDKIADLGCYDAGEHRITGSYFIENDSDYSVDFFLDYNGCNPYALFTSIDFAVHRGEGYQDQFIGDFSGYLSNFPQVFNDIMGVLFGLLSAIFMNSLAFWLFVALYAAYAFKDDPKIAFLIFIGFVWLGYFAGMVDIWIAFFITLLSFIVAEHQGYIQIRRG